jgi:hypothetical protein
MYHDKYMQDTSMENATVTAVDAANLRPSSKKAGDPRYGRSAVGNGRCLLAGVDGRSTWMRRAKDILAAHLSDLGGADNVSEAERSIVQRITVLTIELERLEVRFASSDHADPAALDLYTRASGNLRRLLESLGLERRMKDINTMTLGAALRSSPP